MGPASLPGKSRPPWTTERCSMRSKWAWTGATHGSPKNHRSLQHLHGVCALPAHVTKTMMVTRRKPPPHLPPTAYRPLTPQSPVAPNPTFPCRRGRRRSQESPAHLGLQCVVRCVHYGLGLVQPTHRSPKLTGLFSTLGKSRPPWTTVRCSMSSIWAWTDATQGSPKLTGLYCIRESPATEHVLSLLL